MVRDNKTNIGTKAVIPAVTVIPEYQGVKTEADRRAWREVRCSVMTANGCAITY